MADKHGRAIKKYGKSRLSGSQRGFWIKRAIAVVLLLYGGYAAFHVSTGLNRGCRLETALKTMTPVKELYLKPKLDSELQQSPEARATGLIWAGDIELVMELMGLTLSDCFQVEYVAEELSLTL